VFLVGREGSVSSIIPTIIIGNPPKFPIITRARVNTFTCRQRETGGGGGDRDTRGQTEREKETGRREGEGKEAFHRLINRRLQNNIRVFRA